MNIKEMIKVRIEINREIANSNGVTEVNYYLGALAALRGLLADIERQEANKEILDSKNILVSEESHD